MRRTPWRAISVLVILGLALLSCDGPNRGTNTQPSSASGFHLVVTSSPNAVRGATAGVPEGDGGCALIQVEVFDEQGRLVDGVEIVVTTTLGRFKLPDDKVGGFLITSRGVATAGWCAKGERGTAIITASAEDAFATTTITIF